MKLAVTQKYLQTLVTSFLDQNVDRVAILINGTPQIVQSPANRDKYFIKEPGVTQAASALLQLAGIVRPKSIAPLPNGFIGNLYTTLCQKIFDVAETETEPVVQPNGVANDFRWESMTVIH